MADSTPTSDDIETLVQIPGVVHATYLGGRITSLTFMPHASSAGYFGPAAEVSDGDHDLDVVETDGPFWTAVQEAIPNPPVSEFHGPPSITWVE